MATSLQAVPPSYQLSELDRKSTNEMPQNLHEKEVSGVDTGYSEEGYESVAAITISMLALSASAEKEHQAVEQAFVDVGIDNICTPEILLNQSKISEKKDQFKQLLTFLDESESRLEKMLTDLKWQVLPKADVDKDFRKGFEKGYEQAVGERKQLLREVYNIKRDIVRAYIKFLDFVSNKLSSAKNRYSNLKDVLKSEEDLNEFRVHINTIVNLLEADEEMALASEQKREKAMNTLSLFTHPNKSIAFIRIAEIYKEKIAPYNQACAQIDWHNIYTEAIVSNREKITEKKKELENLCPVLDEMEEKWGKEIPDAMLQAKTSLPQNNQERELLEEFIVTILPLEKELVCIRKKYTLEYLHLLNFLSARYGNYKVGTGEVQFAYEIENKLCGSYVKSIQQLLQKEEATALQVCELTQKLRDRLQCVRSSSSSEQIYSDNSTHLE